MKLLAFLLAFLPLQGQQQPPAAKTDPDTKQYQNLLLGLKLNYPKDWELTTDKKGVSRILIPIEGTSDRAVVELMSASFRSEPFIWQELQVGINKSMKRTVDRQWQEEILGVPLLLTKATYSEKGTQRTTVTGLVYSLGFYKLLYHVTAAPGEFDQVDHMWRDTLQSLRTWSGDLPTAEDGSKIERKDPKAPPEPVVPATPHPLPGPKTGKTVKAPVAGTVEVGGQKFSVCAPATWTFAAGADGTFTLKSASVDSPIKGTVVAGATADPARVALAKASGESLNDFTKVDARDDMLAKANRAGALVATTWRTGTGASGPLTTCEATVQVGDAYMLLTFRSATAADAARKQIAALLDLLSFEPAQ